MSLFDLQDVCIAIGSITTLDLPMVVDLIGIYGLKRPYCTLTTTNWFLQALSVIPRGSWGDVARRSYHDPLGKSGIPPPPCAAAASLAGICSGQLDEENPSVLISSGLLVQADEGVSLPVVDLIDTTQGICLRAPHQLQTNIRKAIQYEASQQEESNATTLTLVGAVYHRQSKKISFRVSHLVRCVAPRWSNLGPFWTNAPDLLQFSSSFELRCSPNPRRPVRGRVSKLVDGSVCPSNYGVWMSVDGLGCHSNKKDKGVNSPEIMYTDELVQAN
ncbi:hypothetical protein F511_31301 [Dorcoceras hygrometricum]|uniref:Uncharacterized protein n=1 Tax=Dorcoceras hygrometricum TaxID=472368 RepID=A0A2Z7BTS0_9LAMI|nr:hypothetical protein F511_31301 [Dorcoceras hygrometricum]